MRVMNVHVYGINLVSLIFSSAFAHDISGFMVWGTISYNSRSHLVFLQGKVNIARKLHRLLTAISSTDLSPIKHVWDTMEQELNSFSRACHNHCQTVKTGARCLGQSIAG